MKPLDLLLPFALLVAASAAVAAKPPPRLEFSVATDEGPALATKVPEAVEVDWEALAKAALQEVNLDEPTAADRKKAAAKPTAGALDPADLQFHFEAALPSELSTFSFFLLTDAGIARLRPAKLCGTVRLGYGKGAPRGTATRQSSYFGLLCFEKGPMPKDGMVLASSVPIEPKVERLGPKQTRLTGRAGDGGVVYEWAEPGKRPLTLKWGIEHGPRPVSQYRVDIAGRPSLVYVRWSKDPTQLPCPDMATLFEVGERLEKVLSSMRCDFSPSRLAPLDLR